MKKLLIGFFFLVLCTSLLAQTGSEILLFDLKVKKGKVILSNPKNITNHPGYDNQPSFHASDPIVYYSSFNEDGRADIKSYNYKTGESKQVTTTPEREYSPTLTPDRTGLSCIIQRDNGAQDLGRYALDGGDPYVIVDSLVVGYHVWADNSHLGLFILGANGAPNTLHYMRLPTKEDTVIAENIGRALHRVPDERAISFVHKVSQNDWQIRKLNTENMTISTIAATLPGREDICWTDDKKIISSDGTKLFFLDPKEGGSWKEVTLESGGQLLKGITRLAVSGEGDRLAVVIAE